MLGLLGKSNPNNSKSRYSSDLKISRMENVSEIFLIYESILKNNSRVIIYYKKNISRLIIPQKNFSRVIIL